MNIHVSDQAAQEASDELFTLALKVQPDVARTCILAALEACVARALLHQDAKINPRSLITFFPRESAKILDFARLMRRRHRHTDIEKKFKAFFMALDRAKAKTILYAASGFPEVTAEDAALKHLLDDWVHCCATGHALLQALHAQLHLHPLTSTAALHGQLGATLQAIVAGENPLLQPNGTITMPRWAERREFDRIPIRRPALLIRDSGAVETVTAIDISNEGVGLQTSKPLTVGDRVILRMSVDRILSGTVTWAQSGRAAVRFSHPIDAHQLGADDRG